MMMLLSGVDIFGGRWKSCAWKGRYRKAERDYTLMDTATFVRLEVAVAREVIFHLARYSHLSRF